MESSSQDSIQWNGLSLTLEPFLPGKTELASASDASPGGLQIEIIIILFRRRLIAVGTLL